MLFKPAWSNNSTAMKSPLCQDQIKQGNKPGKCEHSRQWEEKGLGKWSLESSRNSETASVASSEPEEMNWRGGQGPGHLEICSFSQGFSEGLNYYDSCDRALIRAMLNIPSFSWGKKIN